MESAAEEKVGGGGRLTEELESSATPFLLMMVIVLQHCEQSGVTVKTEGEQKESTMATHSSPLFSPSTLALSISINSHYSHNKPS